MYRFVNRFHDGIVVVTDQIDGIICVGITVVGQWKRKSIECDRRLVSIRLKWVPTVPLIYLSYFGIMVV